MPPCSWPSPDGARPTIARAPQSGVRRALHEAGGTGRVEPPPRAHAPAAASRELGRAGRWTSQSTLQVIADAQGVRNTTARTSNGWRTTRRVARRRCCIRTTWPRPGWCSKCRSSPRSSAGCRGARASSPDPSPCPRGRPRRCCATPTVTCSRSPVEDDIVEYVKTGSTPTPDSQTPLRKVAQGSLPMQIRLSKSTVAHGHVAF